MTVLPTASNPVHPKVAAAGGIASVIALVFTILAAVGVVVPDNVQNAASVIAVDLATLIPVIVAYFKKVA